MMARPEVTVITEDGRPSAYKTALSKGKVVNQDERLR